MEEPRASTLVSSRRATPCIYDNNRTHDFASASRFETRWTPSRSQAGLGAIPLSRGEIMGTFYRYWSILPADAIGAHRDPRVISDLMDRAGYNRPSTSFPK